MRRHAPAALFFLLASIAMTWPLARVLRFAVADPSDPYLNTWILDWDYYATFVSPRPLFEANILYPAHHTLALSEHLFALAMIASPFRALGMAPLTAHNLLMLLGFAACGFTAYLLGAYATGSRAAGVIAGIVYAFVPWRFTHLTHVQYAWTAALPLLLLALLRFDGTWKRGAAVATAVAFAGSTNLHVFAFGGAAAALTVGVIAMREQPARNVRWLAMLGAAALLGVLVVLPLLLPYRAAMREYGFRGSREETRHYSAVPSDWLVSNFHNRFYLPLGTNNGTTDPERWLFPGFGVIALSAIALARRESRSRTATLAAVSWIALGFFGSLGLNFPLHTALFNAAGVYRGIRAPARWAMIAHAGLALAAAIGARHFSRRTAAIVAAFLLIELHAAPVRYFMTTGRASETDRWLAETRPNAVLNLPLNEGNSEFVYVLGATKHHRNIVNPLAQIGTASPMFLERLDDEAVPWLRRNRVDLVVVRTELLGSKGPAVRDFISRSGLRFVKQVDTDLVFDTTERRPSVDTAPVDRFLRGEPLDLARPFGALDLPAHEQRVTGPLEVAGWAIARGGVRDVYLLLGNGAMKVRASPCVRPDVQNAYLMYPPTAITGFCARIERPWWIPEWSDIQVEIVDNTGWRTRLTDRWFTWARK
jgi:hypothetical protein